MQVTAIVFMLISLNFSMQCADNDHSKQLQFKVFAKRDYDDGKDDVGLQ